MKIILYFLPEMPNFLGREEARLGTAFDLDE
jgi:hypothetical protein